MRAASGTLNSLGSSSLLRGHEERGLWWPARLLAGEIQRWQQGARRSGSWGDTFCVPTLTLATSRAPNAGSSLLSLSLLAASLHFSFPLVRMVTNRRARPLANQTPLEKKAPVSPSCRGVSHFAHDLLGSHLSRLWGGWAGTALSFPPLSQYQLFCLQRQGMGVVLSTASGTPLPLEDPRGRCWDPLLLAP